MFGKNKISPIIKSGGEKLSIVSIFKTIQGEGPFASRAAIFVRLGGCNLKCDFCDTEFDKYKDIKITDILKKIKKLSKKIDLIVITGGEPLRQPIEKFCNLLLKENYQVQIETNGTIKRKLNKKISIICSPKLVNKKYNINKELIDFASHFKFLVEKKGDYNFLPKLKTEKPIYVQPIDSYDKKKNLENQKYAIKLALENNYRLSIQLHKILGLE